MRIWILAARPKTLIASISPVAMGMTLASTFLPLTFFLTLLFAILIQIGTNLANDYYDFKKGADTSERKGPVRITQQGLASAKSVKIAFCLAFLFAALVCLPLIHKGGSFFFFLMSLSILFGLLYTAGPYPLAYLGLGELFVLPFFGPVATLGTAYLQDTPLSFPLFLAGLVPGFFSCAILTINNLRDEEEDRRASKKTLIVRFGSRFGKFEYAFCIFSATLITFYLSRYNGFVLICLVPLACSLLLLDHLFSGRPNYASLLVKTVQIFFFYTILFCLSYSL